MVEFIIAILVVSLLWILWDVVKLLLGDKYKEERLAVGNNNPVKEKMERYAQAFESLANTFGKMPCKKEKFSEEDIREIFGNIQRKVCIQCKNNNYCWGERRKLTYKNAFEMLHMVEEQGDLLNEETKRKMNRYCKKSSEFLQAMQEDFRIAKLNLMWSNRMMENREAVAGQLLETSKIMEAAAALVYEAHPVAGALERQLEIKLRMRGMILREVREMKKSGQQLEILLTIRTVRKGRCVSLREISAIVSEIYGRKMMADHSGRSVVNHEYASILLLAEPEYYMLNGAARITKDGEVISGDNFTMFRKEDGKMIMSLSDGMGSGRKANQESEMVIDLLEQFLHAGFAKETAVQMIHSTLMLQNDNQLFSTVDLCMIDLYSGECELLKIGASTTFFKRKEWVESVTSTSLPMGILQALDYESVSKRLGAGEFVIMVSDGVLDALPDLEAEEILKEIILQQNTRNAQEMAKAILSKVLLYHQCQAEDDMTVLVGGLWRN